MEGRSVAGRLGVAIGLLGLVQQASTGAPARADGPAYVVKDLTGGSVPGASSDPRVFVDLSGGVLFAARDDDHGVELWRTDGTAAGTALVADIAPGRADGVTGDARAVSGDTLYFPGAGGIWASDGSAAGTRLVAPIEASRLLSDGDRLYAIHPLGDCSDHGFALWRIDLSLGTSTLLHEFPFADIEPSLTLVGGRLFFTAANPAEGLWVSDGTPDGTRLLRSVQLSNNEGGNNETGLIAVGGQLFFVAYDDAGWELWRSDGTEPGTRRVRDINPGPAPGIHFNDYLEQAQPFFAALDGTLLFMADDGVSGLELWRSDGTEAGTARLTDAGAGALGIDGTLWTEDRSDVAQSVIRWLPFAGRLFFTARADDIHPTLWVTDGTAEGTSQVAILSQDWAAVTAAAASPTRLFLGVVEPPGGAQLLSSDGTAAGTTALAAVPMGDLAPALGGVMFAGNDSHNGFEPWISDGTAAGTHLVADLRRGRPGLEPMELTDLHGTLVFSADDGEHGRELWRSRGSADETTPIADIAPGPAPSNPSYLVASGGTLYFVADDGTHGRELWRSDGTAAGTALVRDLNPGSGSSDPHALVADGRGGIYVYAYSPATGNAMWASDGTAGGTRLLRSIGSGAGPFLPDARLVVLGNIAFFVGDDAEHGEELWRTDGTREGTNLMFDLFAGGESSAPAGLTRLGDAAIFGASDGTDAGSLWRTDGAAQETSRLAVVGQVVGRPVVTAAGTMVFAGSVYVGTNRSVHLWTSDGTVAGTRRASNAVYDPELTAVGGNAFALSGPAYDQMVTRVGCGDLVESSDSHSPFSSLTGLGDRLVFAQLHYPDGGVDPDGGLRIWTSDGTRSGTVVLQDLPPPVYAPRPVSAPTFVRSGDYVYFAGPQGDAGDELWALPVAALPPADAPPCAPTPTPTLPRDRTPAGPFQCPDGPRCTVLELAPVTAHAGDQFTLTATLHTRDLPIAGVQNDIDFPAGIAVLPDADGAPACAVEPSIDKGATTFAFFPHGCTPGEDCTAIRALVLSIDNVDPIADGAWLYRCTARLSPDLEPGEYSLALSNLGASDPDGLAVELQGIDGVVSVDYDAGDRPATSDTANSDGGGCETAPPGATAPALGLGLLGLLALRAVGSLRGRGR